MHFTTSVDLADDHEFMSVEAPTGYLQPEFRSHYSFDSVSGELTALPLVDGVKTNHVSGISQDPLIFATQDSEHAMGVYVPPGQDGFSGYARFSYDVDSPSGTHKWSLPFHLSGDPLSAGKYAFSAFVVVGTLEEVQQSMADLAKGS